MNAKLSLLLVAAAAVAGLALAQSNGQQTPVERLTALEIEVTALKSELAELKKSAGAATAADEFAATRASVDALVTWARAQSQAAGELDNALGEARAKGFTYGINPDSREVLLHGFASYTAAVHTDSFNPPAPAAPVKKAPQPVRPKTKP